MQFFSLLSIIMFAVAVDEGGEGQRPRQQVKTGKLGGTVEICGRDIELQAPGLSRHEFAGRESTRKTFIEYSAGASRLRAVVRAVTNSGGDAGDKVPFRPGEGFYRLVFFLCPLPLSRSALEQS